jgi:hypothetical protein
VIRFQQCANPLSCALPRHQLHPTHVPGTPQTDRGALCQPSSSATDPIYCLSVPVYAAWPDEPHSDRRSHAWRHDRHHGDLISSAVPVVEAGSMVTTYAAPVATEAIIKSLQEGKVCPPACSAHAHGRRCAVPAGLLTGVCAPADPGQRGGRHRPRSGREQLSAVCLGAGQRRC